MVLVSGILGLICSQWYFISIYTLKLMKSLNSNEFVQLTTTTKSVLFVDQPSIRYYDFEKYY